MDHVKKELVNFVRDGLEEDDLFYLYEPSAIELVELVGERVSLVANYEADGWKFNLNYALKQTLYVLESADWDYRKILIFVSDRFQEADKLALMNAANLNEKESLGCDILAIGIGASYSRSALSVSPRYLHLPSPLHLADILQEEI